MLLWSTRWDNIYLCIYIHTYTSAHVCVHNLIHPHKCDMYMPFIPWLGQQCNDIRVQTVNMYIYIHTMNVCVRMYVYMYGERKIEVYIHPAASTVRTHSYTQL